MGAALGSQRHRVDLDIVFTLRDDLAIEVGDETLVGSDVEGHWAVAVEVEERLEGDLPSDWGSVSLVVPDPESARAQVLVLVDVVEVGQRSEVARSDDAGLQVGTGDHLDRAESQLQAKNDQKALFH